MNIYLITRNRAFAKQFEILKRREKKYIANKIAVNFERFYNS